MTLVGLSDCLDDGIKWLHPADVKAEMQGAHKPVVLVYKLRRLKDQAT